MTIEVKVPDIGDLKDVKVIEVRVKAGDVVDVEDNLITLETDKATMDVPAPAPGTVKEVKVKPGDTVSDLSLFRILVEQAPDAIIFADTQGIIRVWNARATEVFGYAASDALGNSVELIIPHDLRNQHWQGFHEAIQRHCTKFGTRVLATRALRKGGERLYVELAFSIVLDESARVAGSMATARDITQSYIAGKTALKAEAELHSNQPRSTA